LPKNRFGIIPKLKLLFISLFDYMYHNIKNELLKSTSIYTIEIIKFVPSRIHTKDKKVIY